LLAAETRAVVDRAIAQLPAPQAVVITIRDVEGFGAQEVCNVTYLEQMRRTVEAAGRLREEDLDPELQDALIEAFRDWRSG